MKYLKLFEQHQDIKSICKKYNIKNYTINNDGSIDVDGDVDLCEKELNMIPLKFNIVDGEFDCSMNLLSSLDGCPKIVNGSFNCDSNQLINLNGAPINVSGSFDCSMNLLSSLECATEKVDWTFFCCNNNLKNFIGMPKEINGSINCSNNQIFNLKGLSSFNVYFTCANNPIKIILDQISYDKLINFFEIYNDYDPINENIINKFKMNDLLNELDITNFDYDKLKNIYIIK